MGVSEGNRSMQGSLYVLFVTTIILVDLYWDTD